MVGAIRRGDFPRIAFGLCGSRTAAFIGLAAFGTAAARAQLPPPTPGLTLGVSDVLQLPATTSSAGSSWNRVNFLREVEDGSGRWFANDLSGQIYAIDPGSATAPGPPMLYADAASAFPNMIGGLGLASGLITFAFHPDFGRAGSDGYGVFYTSHTEPGSATGATTVIVPASGGVGNQSVLTEWRSTDPSANAFAGTRREVLRIGSPGTFHPLGDLVFNPNATPGDADYGMLYVSHGDGRSFNLPGHTANLQNPGGWLTTISRIDPLGTRSGVPGDFAIPADNPFVGDADPSTADHVFAHGLRNGIRLSWDAVSGALLVADVGENDVEEVNVVRPMANYGWSEREGTFTLGGGPLPGNDDTFGFTYPVSQYDHDEGFAIAGGHVYRGDAAPELRGKFVFGDIVNGRLFYSDLDAMLAADDADPATTAEVFELFLLDASGDPTDLLALINAQRSADGRNLTTRADLRINQTLDGELYLSTRQDGFLRALFSVALPGDANFDGVVDLLDFDILANNFGAPENGFDAPEGASDGDFNFDGVVDLLDFDILAGNFGNSAPAVVPEPASLSLFGVVAMGMLRRRRA